ncbi:hypothetical protein C8R44DRAFT_867355 [Mycena epipterygia]|nr:hypothetical protein C8R44DRAFT_867355 [Mycena epipterygia]
MSHPLLHSPPSPFSLVDFTELVSAALDSPDSAFSPTLSLSLSIPSLHRKKSAQTLHQSRVRILLSKLKTLVRRPRLRRTSISNAKSRLPAPAPSSYLPIEYASLSPPTSESACLPASESDCSHTPPSPTASSFSTSECCSSTERHRLSTPDLSPAHKRPWSVLTIDADFGIGIGNEEADPFAKGAVRIVHRSCEVLPSPAPRLRRRRAREWRATRPSSSSSGSSPASTSYSDSACASPASTDSACAWPPSPSPSPTPTARPARSRSLAHPPRFAAAPGHAPNFAPQPRRPRASSPFPLTLRRMPTTATAQSFP